MVNPPQGQFLGQLSSGDIVRFLPQLGSHYTAGYLKLSAEGLDSLRLTPHILKQVGADRGQAKWMSWGCKDISWVKCMILNQLLEKSRRGGIVQVHDPVFGLSHQGANMNLHRELKAEAGFRMTDPLTLNTYGGELAAVDGLLFREYLELVPRVRLCRTFAFASCLDFHHVLPPYHTQIMSTTVASVEGAKEPTPLVSRMPEAHESRLRGLTPVSIFSVKQWTMVWNDDFVAAVKMPSEEGNTSCHLVSRHHLADALTFFPPIPFVAQPGDH